MDWNEVGAGLRGMLANLAGRLRRKGWTRGRTCVAIRGGNTR